MKQIRRGIDLMKKSWSVLNQDRELIVLPVLSGVATLAAMGLFAIPFVKLTSIVARTSIQPEVGGQITREWSWDWRIYPLLFAFYLVAYSITNPPLPVSLDTR